MSINKEQNDYINNLLKLIDKIDLDSKLDYDKCFNIYKTYKIIEKKINKSDIININDINNILLNDDIKEENIIKFKKFINIKNLYILKEIYNSTIWKDFIINLYNILSLKDNNIELLEKAVFKLLKTYINHFNGCWEIVKFEKNKVKKIEIIEPEHFDFINNYLKKFSS